MYREHTGGQYGSVLRQSGTGQIGACRVLEPTADCEPARDHGKLLPLPTSLSAPASNVAVGRSEMRARGRSNVRESVISARARQWDMQTVDAAT